MTRAGVDLDSCDREPIHLIGAIQPHGALLALAADSLVIDYASANCAGILGQGPEALLGQPIAALIGAAQAARIPEIAQQPSQPELLRPWVFEFEGATGARVAVECLPHRNGAHILLEFFPPEPAPAPVWEEEYLRRAFISGLVGPGALDALAEASAAILREVTGFDRVMIYRFAEDGHGAVIAEATDRPDSFLGLHYPASDIPEPARRHFLLNVMRAIPDITAASVPIHARGGQGAGLGSAAPLDLTFAKLRAVAPVHVEYLGNMGVGASLSISLITNGRLWGLVACHHYGPRRLSSSRLRFVELLGATVSALLQSIENTRQLERSIEAEKTAFRIEQEARDGRALPDLIADWAPALMALLQASGLVLVRDGGWITHGAVPAGRFDPAPLLAGLEEGVACTARLSDHVALTPAQREGMAGAAVLALSESGDEALILLRPPFDQTIRWAGRPEKALRRDAQGAPRLSPRGSFALWREERRDQSRPFDRRDREALRILRRALFALSSLERARAAQAAQARAQAEETRLRHALLDAARASSLAELASAIAHELRQPLAAITNYLGACRQELRQAGRRLPAGAAGLLDRAQAETARAGELMRRVRSLITTGDLTREPLDVARVLHQALALAQAPGAPPGLRVVLRVAPDLPPVMADPVQIGQVVLNLARNSLAAMAKSPAPVLTVAAEPSPAGLRVTVRDSGCGLSAARRAHLFEPFHGSTTQGMGIGLSLCRSIVEAHGGRIWAEPVERGALFAFDLPAEAEAGADRRGAPTRARPETGAPDPNATRTGGRDEPKR